MAERDGVSVADAAIDVATDEDGALAFFLRGGMFSPDDALAIGSRLLALASASRPLGPADVERARPRTAEDRKRVV